MPFEYPINPCQQASMHYARALGLGHQMSFLKLLITPVFVMLRHVRMSGMKKRFGFEFEERDKREIKAEGENTHTHMDTQYTQYIRPYMYCIV